MDHMDATDDLIAPIPGTDRPIRRLDAQESAFAGELVADADLLRVRVDASSVEDVLWRFADAEHVAGVLDVARRADGQDVLLPWCSFSADAFLARRDTMEQPLSAGEIVTLVGSMLRGIVEIAEADVEVCGRWWLAADGRPLFVPGEGATCTSVSLEILARVRQGCADRALERTLTEISTGMQDAREVVRSIGRWEYELTELAAPRPLHTAVHPPERVSAIPLHQARLPQDAHRVTAQHSFVTSLRGRFEVLIAWVNEHWLSFRLQRRSKARTRENTRTRAVSASPVRTHGSGRGRMLIVGAAVAGVVLVGGLLWPTGEDSSATVVIDAGDQRAGLTGDEADADADADASEESPPHSAEPSPPAEQDAGDSDGEGAQEGVAGVAARLLREISSCAAEDDPHCERAVVQGAGALVMQRLTGSGTGPDADRVVTPVEDYGDIAVLRLAAAEVVPEQMLVISRQNDRWLVRDVYDVADQPSG